jgi:hypothetical protein
MRSRDVRATAAGLLFIAATATSLIATASLGSLLDGPGFLATRVPASGPAADGGAVPADRCLHLRGHSRREADLRAYQGGYVH